MASFDGETANKLLTQVEFYFSDSNLPIDEFLSKEVTKSKDGWKVVVSLALVCSFSRMRNLLGLGNTKREAIPVELLEEVANLLRTSKFLKVSDNGQRIGRGKKLSKPEKVLEQVHRRTIAVSPFEYSIKMEDVASFFSQYAKVNSVRLPHHVGDKRHFCGTALVEFSSEQDAERILKQSIVYDGADLVLIPKSDFDSQRENMIKKLGKSGPSLEDTSSNNESCRGQLVKFTLKRIASGVTVAEKGKADTTMKLEGKEDKKEETGEEVDNADQLEVPRLDSISSEALKDAFLRFGSVKHIEQSEELDSGYVCFTDSDTATKARAAVEFAGGLIVKNKFSIALEAVNGEMEREVLERLSAAQPEGGKEKGGKKESKSKDECTETTQSPKKKKARKER